MQTDYPAFFEREYGASEAEWLRALPAAIGDLDWRRTDDSLCIELAEGGRLHIRWQVLAPRAIALVRLPRLAVRFSFEGTDAVSRRSFMQRFDLYLQRGGG